VAVRKIHSKMLLKSLCNFMNHFCCQSNFDPFHREKFVIYFKLSYSPMMLIVF
jgi:hypothetical protein